MMSVFLDELFDELSMPEVNFELQEISDQLKAELAAQQADELYFDSVFDHGEYFYDEF